MIEETKSRQSINIQIEISPPPPPLPLADRRKEKKKWNDSDSFPALWLTGPVQTFVILKELSSQAESGQNVDETWTQFPNSKMEWPNDSESKI